MFTRWSDFDRTLAFMDEFRRRMDRAFGESEPGIEGYTPGRLLGTTSWPRLNVFDNGGTYLVVAELPGLAEKDLNLSITADTLTLTGERRTNVPEGYSVHRQERVPVKFSRSISFQSRINPEMTRATLRNGLLSVEINKAEEEKPRQISVKAG
jgi:HSP20 family protein